MGQVEDDLRTISDGTRFSILAILLRHDICSGALARRLGISEAAVSQHMRVLREAGLVTPIRRGYFTHYEVDRGRITAIAAELERMAGSERSPCDPELEGCDRRGRGRCSGTTPGSGCPRDSAGEPSCPGCRRAVIREVYDEDSGDLRGRTGFPALREDPAVQGLRRGGRQGRVVRGPRHRRKGPRRAGGGPEGAGSLRADMRRSRRRGAPGPAGLGDTGSTGMLRQRRRGGGGVRPGEARGPVRTDVRPPRRVAPVRLRKAPITCRMAPSPSRCGACGCASPRRRSSP